MPTMCGERLEARGFFRQPRVCLEPPDKAETQEKTTQIGEITKLLYALGEVE